MSHNLGFWGCAGRDRKQFSLPMFFVFQCCQFFMRPSFLSLFCLHILSIFFLLLFLDVTCLCVRVFAFRNAHNHARTALLTRLCCVVMTGLLCLFVCCFNCFLLFFNIKYKSFLAGVGLNFGIANRITGFRIFFSFDRF